MEHSSNLKARLSPKLPRAVFLLCLLQPCLDVLSYWLDAAGCSNALTLGLRFAMLAAMVLGGFCLTERRSLYLTAAGILLILTAGHTLACLQTGYDQLFTDWANLLRIYQFPLAAMFFLSCLRCNPEVYPALRRGLCWCLALIAAVELLSLATGTNPYTYPNKQLGLLGWFYFANSQSAILSVLVPVSLAWIIQRSGFRPIPTLLAAAGSFTLLYFFGTRLAFLALAVTGIGLTLVMLITDRRRKGCIAVLLLCTLVFLALAPLSPMYRNQALVSQNAALKQAQIDRLVAADEAAAKSDGLTGNDLQLARLHGAYEEYLGGLVHKFGMKRVALLYRYSDRAADLADVRRLRLNYCQLLLEDSPVLSTLFGLELGDLTYEGYIYDVENDFHGIFYLCGLAGLILLLIFLGYFLLRILQALFRDFRRYFTLETGSWGIALILCLAHSYATAGVLRRPNASFYFSIVLACIAFLTDSVQHNKAAVSAE